MNEPPPFRNCKKNPSHLASSTSFTPLTFSSIRLIEGKKSLFSGKKIQVSHRLAVQEYIQA